MKFILSTITLIAFILVGGFGFLHAFQMTEHDHMEMSPCPFMKGHEVICNMDALEHISAWQSTFTSILVDNYLLLSLLAFSIWGLFRYKIYRPPDKNILIPIFKDTNRNLPTLYEILFSRGILNSKAY